MQEWQTKTHRVFKETVFHVPELPMSFRVRHGKEYYMGYASTGNMRTGDVGHKRVTCPHRPDERTAEPHWLLRLSLMQERAPAGRHRNSRRTSWVSRGRRGCFKGRRNGSSRGGLGSSRGGLGSNRGDSGSRRAAHFLSDRHLHSQPGLRQTGLVSEGPFVCKTVWAGWANSHGGRLELYHRLHNVQNRTGASSTVESVVDLWRVKRPHIKHYTWVKVVDGVVSAAMLDRFYMSHGIMCHMYPVGFTEHYLVSSWFLQSCPQPAWGPIWDRLQLWSWSICWTPPSLILLTICSKSSLPRRCSGWWTRSVFPCKSPSERLLWTLLYRIYGTVSVSMSFLPWWSV